MNAAKQDRGWFSSKRKMEAVLRLLGGEDLDLLSRELGAVVGVPEEHLPQVRHWIGQVPTNNCKRGEAHSGRRPE